MSEDEVGRETSTSSGAKAVTGPDDEVATALWNTLDGVKYPEPYSTEYAQGVLEQYRIYVDIADRVAARRLTTNTLFVTLNTAVLAATSAFFGKGFSVSRWLLLIPVAGVLTECGAWWMLLHYYRKLADAKWLVVRAFEEKLPARAFARAEWDTVLKVKTRKRRITTLSGVEKGLPILFASIYATAAVIAFVTHK